LQRLEPDEVGNLHVRFLGEELAAMPTPYPTGSSLLSMLMHGFGAELLVLRIHWLGLLDYNIDILSGKFRHRDGSNGENRKTSISPVKRPY